MQSEYYALHKETTKCAKQNTACKCYLTMQSVFKCNYSANYFAYLIGLLNIKTFVHTNEYLQGVSCTVY